MTMGALQAFTVLSAFCDLTHSFMGILCCVFRLILVCLFIDHVSLTGFSASVCTLIPTSPDRALRCRRRREAGLLLSL